MKMPCLLFYYLFQSVTQQFRNCGKSRSHRASKMVKRMRNMKNRTISSDIKRALSGRGFLTGVAGMALIIALSSMESIIGVVRNPTPLHNGYHAQFIMNALSTDWVTVALPILCALPYTTAFVDDIKSGFIKQYLPRSGKAAYIKGKLVACALSGGLAPFIGILFAYGLAALIFTPMELALSPDEVAQPYFTQLFSSAVLFFFSGAFWSLVGFSFAALTQSRYMAYASPFILYYVLIILSERYFDGLYVLYPKEWLLPSEVWKFGNFGVTLLLTELMALLCIGFTIIAKRRLSNV